MYDLILHILAWGVLGLTLFSATVAVSVLTLYAGYLSARIWNWIKLEWWQVTPEPRTFVGFRDDDDEKSEGSNTRFHPDREWMATDMNPPPPEPGTYIGFPEEWDRNLQEPPVPEKHEEDA